MAPGYSTNEIGADFTCTIAAFIIQVKICGQSESLTYRGKSPTDGNLRDVRSDIAGVRLPALRGHVRGF